MEIYCYMAQKLTAARKGKKTGINFPYLDRISKNDMAAVMKKVYLN